jgi:hypothetical protein
MSEEEAQVPVVPLPRAAALRRLFGPEALYNQKKMQEFCDRYGEPSLPDGEGEAE